MMPRSITSVYLGVALILTVAIITQGHINNYLLGMARYEFSACSSELSNLISEVCNGTYHDPYGKRANYLHKWKVFIPKQQAKRVLNSNYRQQSGLANECCTKRCTFEELFEYCGPYRRPISNDLLSKIGETLARPRTTTTPSTNDDDTGVVITATPAKSAEIVNDDITNYTMNQKKSLADVDIISNFFKMLRSTRYKPML